MPLPEKITVSKREVTNRDILDFLLTQVLPSISGMDERVRQIEISMSLLKKDVELVNEKASKMEVLREKDATTLAKLDALTSKLDALILTVNAHDISLYGEKGKNRDKGLMERVGDSESWIGNRSKIEWLFVGAVVVQVVIIISGIALAVLRGQPVIVP